MQRTGKLEFLSAYGFPIEWETWGLYPDALFQGQLAATEDDEAPHPDEHLRYGAFVWWVRKDRALPKETLIQLCRLAALDPDPGMAGAAVHDILFHPMADAEVVSVATELAQRHDGWSSWHSSISKEELFRGLLREGQMLWAEREAAHRVALDLLNPRLTELALRELFAGGQPLVLRGLVEHPNLPQDLLQILSQRESGHFAKVIRSMASRRLAGKRVDPTDYARKYSPDPWSWPRSR